MKTIIELARKAGIKNDCDGIWCEADQLERFAALIREAVIAELVAGNGEPVATKWIHPSGRIRTTTPDSITDCDAAWQVKDRLFTADQLAGAVARETERCAQKCESARETIWEYHPAELKAAACNVCTNLAAAIRSGK